MGYILERGMKIITFSPLLKDLRGGWKGYG